MTQVDLNLIIVLYLVINQSINQSFNVSNSRYKPELQEGSETANIPSIGI